MNELRFSEEHVWVRLDDDGSATCGISDYAQGELGDVVFVELPEIGAEAGQGEDVAVIESVKTASDIKMPVSGTITAVNQLLVDHPEKINESPLDDGWLMRCEPSDLDQFQELMDEDAYQEFIGSL